MGSLAEAPRMSEEAVCAQLLSARALEIRDVDGGQDPFHYSSGNFGPGYVDVKGTVGVQGVFKTLVEQVALKAADTGATFDWVAGNATGGMVPAYQFREDYQAVTDREVGYVYVRGSRKQGGKGELVTGLQHVPATNPDGSPTEFTVMEELVNFAETTTNSMILLRGLGFTANRAFTMLFYGHDAAKTRLADNQIELTYLTTLPHLIDAAEDQGTFSPDAIASYREFLADPADWQASRGLTPQELGGKHG